MPDLPIVLAVLAIFLTIVTLVGHGIWVLLAAIFGGGRKKASPNCPFCGHSTAADRERCDWCGRQLASPVAKELNDLAAVRRQLQRFRQNGTLKPEAVDRLLGRLQEYRQRLLQPVEEKRAAPAVAALIVEEPERSAEAPPAAPRKETIRPPVPEIIAKPQATIDAVPQPAPHPEAAAPPVPQFIARPQAASTPVPQPAPRSDTTAPLVPRPRPQPAAQPSRSWSEMLAAFMEQRNIRWGELIGGLLFVCSSVALVVSLWKTLDQIPYFKFFIFVSITSALFGVALYAHHRWKLESTSRALLVIAMLLVPLNFVAMAIMATAAKGDWTPWISELVSLAIFALLGRQAVRILVPDGQWPALAAVLGDSIAVVLASQLVHTSPSAWLLVGTGSLPVALFAGAIGCYVFSPTTANGPHPQPLSRRERGAFRTDMQIGFLFTLLGITAFSTVVALGVLAAKALMSAAGQFVAPGDVTIVLEQFSVLLAMTAVPVLAGGLAVMCGSRRDKELAAYHLAGTIVAMVAMSVMLAALALAWPAPGWLMAVAVLNGIALVFAAFRWRLPVLHSGAIACAALAYLIAFYLLIGELPLRGADPDGLGLLTLMIDARSGTALGGLFLVLAVVSELLARVGRRRHGAIYLGGSSVVAVAGLLLVTVHGVQASGADALRAAILYGVYGAGSLALTARWRRLGLSYLGLVLVATSALWAMWSAGYHVGPPWGAVLAIEGLVMVAAAAVLDRYATGAWHDPWKMFGEDSNHQLAVSMPRSKGLSLADIFRIPLIHVGEAATMLAALLAIWTAWSDRATILADPTAAPIVASVAIAVVYFLLAWLYRSPERTWIASSVALAGAIHALNYNYFQSPDPLGPNWTIALLGHATLALVGVACLERLCTHHAKRDEYAEDHHAERDEYAEDHHAERDEYIGKAIGEPLANSALVSSVLVLPTLIFGRSAGSLWLACCLPWLAGVWLVLARRKHSVALFAGHQAALAFAALAAATVCMKRANWFPIITLNIERPNLLERIWSYNRVFLDPRNLQAYGIALGLLSLVWVLVRIIDLRRSNRAAFGRRVVSSAAQTQQPRSENGGSALRLTPPYGPAQSLLQNDFSVDWCIRHGVVAMQWFIMALCTLAEVSQELVGSPVPGVVPNAFGPTAWILLGVLAAMLVAALWQRWRTAELVAVLLLAATLPCLIAGQFASDLAVASASRWALAVGFAVSSIAVWGREPLADACRRLGAGPPLDVATSLISMPRVARGVLLATMVFPALAITVQAALLQIGGTPPAGPLANTFFAKLGPTQSYLVPLALLIGALVGYALRERSSGYAFSAGLVLKLAVVLGYALHTTLGGRPFDATFFATLIELFAITAAAWAIVWLIARKRFDVWREEGTRRAVGTGGEAASDPSSIIPHPSSLISARPSDGVNRWSRGLMRAQIGMAVTATALVLGIALLDLALLPVGWQTWSVTVGGPLGWIALLLPIAALQLRGRLRPQAVGLSGMAVLGLLACTVGGLQASWNVAIEPVWGYRTLMLGWAVYALLIVAATWWVASLRTAEDAAGPPQGLIRMAAVWVRVAGILAVLLGLQAAFWHTEEQLWAAAAIAVASAAGATMAVWRRREGWAFAAALGVNVAASLVVWHFELMHDIRFDAYWLRLVQANVIASAAVAVVWLATRKRLYELREMTLGESPLLALQVLLPVVGNCVLAVIPVLWLIQAPESLPAWMFDLAAPQGWMGLALTATVAAWYLRQTLPAGLLHVLGGLALVAGVLAACNAASLDQHPGGPWIAYHTLTTAWAAAGLVVLAAALAGRAIARNLVGPESLIEPWVATIGTITVAMATLHAFHDPARPWWAAGAILAVSLTAGLIAVLLRKPVHVYVSGLLIDLAGTIVWWAYSTSGARWPAWHPADIAGLVEANVLCLAVGSIVWSLVDFVRRVGPASPSERRPTMIETDGSIGGPALAGGERVPPYEFGSLPSFAHLAAQLGAVGIGLVTAAGVIATFVQPPIPIERLDWIALAAVVAATVVCLRRRTELTWPTLYCLGLSAVGFGLLARQLGPRMFCWSTADELAGYTLFAAALAWCTHHADPRLQIAKCKFAIGNLPFAICNIQAAVMAVAGTLALWVTIDFQFDGCSYGYELLRWFPAGRMAAVPGLFLLLLSAIVMAGVTRETWRARWQYGTLKMGVLVLSGLGWAMLAKNGPAPWLHRSVILMVASAAVGLSAGFGLKRLLPSGSDWIERGRQAVPVLAGLAIAMLAAVLVQESLLFEEPNGAPMLPIAKAVVIAALASLVAGCIAFAVTPAFDPLRLSDRGRQAYVYAAEALAAAIGLHVWLTMPWLFHGYLIDYWMLIVMAVAFLGAGLGEWFHRRGQAVLAEPLAHTALMLPLLPAIGFWIAPMDEVHSPWHLVGRAPAVWFLMAMFYGVLTVTRRSWKCAVLAVLTANLGLWVSLELSQFHFLHNPQLFVIPLALAGLVAEYLNHDRLSDAQSAAFRYLALGAIYVSSTADMFIAGLGNSWSLPLVLMVLSVAGMLAGIMFRVRSFLFLGFTFLVLDFSSMIWYAAHDLGHTWVWYVCGIALGAAILAMFALFEKRRNEVLAAVEQLKVWEK